MKLRILFSLFVIGIISSSCSKKFSSENEMYEWINKEENGLVKTKDLGRLSFSVKYLPVEYLVYNDLKRQPSYTKKQMDSLNKAYSSSMSFLLTVDFKDSSPGDNTLMYGLSSYDEYRERIEQLNFRLNEYVQLVTEKGEYTPVLWTLENTYSVGNKKNIYIVFTAKPDDKSFTEAKNFDLVFNDEIFATGISHFVFDHTKLKDVPAINFWNTKM